MSAPLTVLYFAWMKERVGVAEEVIALPAGVSTVAGLIAFLADLDPRHAAAFQNRQTVRCAVNQEFADPETLVQPGDEVAFFPPVTGG